MRCGRALSRGRSCCHVKGHDGKHSHTWQLGDARYLDIDGKIVDMETGQVAGYSGDLGNQVIDEIVSERITNPPTSDEKQAKARKVLEMMYGARIPDECKRVHAAPPAGYDWHYGGTYKAFGADCNGHDVTFDFETGRVQRIYSLNQRRDAVEYARRFGPAKAAKKFDIPTETIRSWVKRG